MGQSTPLFSVVIPTYGPAVYLDQVLRGLAIQTEKNFETIIVDNNGILTHAGRNLPRPSQPFRIVHEPQNGLSYARNAGIANSHGRYLAFLDDDGVPDREWLANLAVGMDRYQALMAGGTVELVLPREEPVWFSRGLRLLLSELFYDGKDIPDIGEDRYIVGANMCIAREAFHRAGTFSHSFDRTANSLRSSGELEFGKRLQRQGEHISFIAKALVRHQISEYRLSKKYFMSRSYWQGRSDALLEVKWGRPESFGRRDNGRNFIALIQALADVVLVDKDRLRFPKLLDLVREYGYCLQYALLTRLGSQLPKDA